MRRSLAIAFLFLVVAPGAARASAWYYTWQCSGGCAPGQLAISGVEGPFGSYDQCEGVRANDSRRDYFLAEGNLGGTNTCEESDAPPTPGGGSSGRVRVAPLARDTVAAVAGPAYRIEDATGIEPSTGSTEGIEAGFQIGGRPGVLGIELALGYQRSSVTAPHFGAGARTIEFVPLLLGFTSSPAIVRGDHVEVRLDLAADVGDFFRVGCTDCDADLLTGDAFVGLLRGGVDTYLGHDKSFGIGVAAIAMFGSQGNVHDPVAPSMIEVRVPTFLIQVSLLFRRHDGVDW